MAIAIIMAASRHCLIFSVHLSILFCGGCGCNDTEKILLVSFFSFLFFFEDIYTGFATNTYTSFTVVHAGYCDCRGGYYEMEELYKINKKHTSTTDCQLFSTK